MQRAWLAILLIGCSGGGSDSGFSGGGPGELPADLPDGGVGPTHDVPPGSVALEVTVTGPGRIHSEPAGIDCGGGGTECLMVLAGKVTLSTDDGTTVRWTGDCAGNGDCAVASGATRRVSAETFAPLVVTADGEDHGDDACHAIAALPGGGFVVTGETRRLAAGRNAWTRAYSASGTPSWTYELSTPSEGSDAGRGVVALADGSAVVVGSWYSGSDSRFNYFVSRFSPTGTAVNTTGELIGDDHYASVAASPSGSLVFAGARNGTAWLEGGDWTASRAGAANRVALASNGDALVVGTNAGHGWVARYRGAAEMWSQTFETGGADSADDIAAFSGGFAIAGSTDGAGWIRVFDDAGSVTWDVAPSAGWTWRAVAPRKGGGLVAAGAHGTDLIVRAFAADGTVLWTRAHANASASGAAVDADGNVLVCGTQMGASADALALRYRQ